VQVIDPHNVQEIFFDTIHEVKITGSVARIALLSRQDGTGVIILRLVNPVSELADVIQALTIALASAGRQTP